MRIAVVLAFDERAAVRLLNWLARENAGILRSRSDLPLLYDSGVVYERESDEEWCDILNLLARGKEDCDGLSAARAGELIARGWKALVPGEPGYEEARRLKLRSIKAECYIRTREPEGQPALYHCLVRYWVGGQEYRDDPSARLGMYGGRIAPDVKARWAAARKGAKAPRFQTAQARAWRTQ